MARLPIVGLLFVAASTLVPCRGSGAEVAQVVVTPATATLEVGRTITLQAHTLDATGAPTTHTVVWESSDVSKATVDTNGTATGLAAGPVSITAIAGTVRSGAALLTVTAPVTGPGPSSMDKIDDALKSGAIDEATAMTYWMFTLFKDARLPAAYRGDDSRMFESNTVDRLYELWETFSDVTKQTLFPFLVPPAYVGSWASPAPIVSIVDNLTCQLPSLNPNWTFRPPTGGRVKVWYEKSSPLADSAKVDALIVEIETRIWPTVVGSLGMPEPLSDGARGGCNGGDDRLDVYLVDMLTYGKTLLDLGQTRPVRWARKESPAFILLRYDPFEKEMKATAAHEFTHVTQWAAPVAAPLDDYRWLKEATAQFAIDAVYPAVGREASSGLRECWAAAQDFEQCVVKSFFETPDESLETESSEFRRYAGYLFFQFLARTLQPGIIGDVWKSAAAQTDQILAVDKGIPGGFKDQWPKFAKALWNQDPVNSNSFEGWDRLKITPSVRGGAILDITLAGQPGQTQKIDGNIKHLATHYYHFKVNDPHVRSLSFRNHLFAVTPFPDSAISVQAFFKKQGGIWQYEHWSERGIEDHVKSFCLDLVAERIEELVIVMSNSHPSRDMVELNEDTMPRVSVSNVGCWRYTGTTRIGGTGTTAIEKYTSSVTATVTFERWRSPQQPDGVAGREIFQVESGAVSAATFTKSDPQCTTTSNGFGQVEIGVGSGSLEVDLGLDIGTGTVSRRVAGWGTARLQTRTEMRCPNVPPIIHDGEVFWGYLELPVPAEMLVEVKPDGTIQGSYTRSTPPPWPFSDTRTMTWDFKPLRQ